MKEYKIKNVKSIVSTINVKPPKDYNPTTDGYVYLFVDEIQERLNKELDKHNRKLDRYLGYHKGDLGFIDGTYFFSISGKKNSSKFRSLVSNPSSKIRFEILKYGKAADMENLEHKMLKEADAKKNPIYYNDWNGKPAYTGVDLDRITSLNQQVVGILETFKYKLEKETKIDPIEFCKKFNKTSEFKINYNLMSDIMDYPPLQVRTSVENKSVIDSVRDACLLGDTTSIEPIVTADVSDNVIEKEDKTMYEGGIVLIGGNHRRQGCEVAKAVSMFELHIPNSMIEDWTELELKMLGDSFNPPEETPRTPMTDEDLKQRLFDNLDELGIPIDSDFNMDYLMRVAKKSKPAARTIILNTDSEDDARQKNKTRINWGSSGWPAQLVPVVNAIEKKGDTMCILMSSGQYPFERIYQNVMEKVWDSEKVKIKKGNKIKKVTLLVKHKQKHHRQDWNNGIQDEKITLLEPLEKLFGVTFNFIPLPETRSNFGVTAENFWDGPTGKNWLRTYNIKLKK